MAKNQQHNQSVIELHEKGTTCVERKIYRAPRLKQLGTVAALTAAADANGDDLTIGGISGP